MNQRDKHQNRSSFASREPRLRSGVPAQLRHTGQLQNRFDHARDPMISAQLKSLQQSETKRREDGEGSSMVKLHKPFPELRPKHDLSQIRKTFDQNYLKEHRRAQMKQFHQEEKSHAAEKSQPKTRFPERTMER